MTAGFHVLAPAKVNLHLHMTGRAANGYHYLDSLVVFADVGDRLDVSASADFSLTLGGEACASLADCAPEDNLVSKAAALFAEHYGTQDSVRIHLEKLIPAGGGLGGGSADAAAALLALPTCTGHEIDMDVLDHIASRLGSDIVACLHFLRNKQPVIMRETGNKLYPAPSLPPLPALLVKPLGSCPTPQVYKAYAASGAIFSSDVSFPDNFPTPEALCDFLNKETRNDLSDAAIRVNPEVAEVLDSLSALDGVLMARLSGSGSCCFAIFADRESADIHARNLATKNPDWWVRATFLR